MKNYLIVYDLKNPRTDDYSKIEAEIKGDFVSHRKINNTTWIIKTNDNASTILMRIEDILSSEDRLSIVEIGNDRAFKNPIGGFINTEKFLVSISLAELIKKKPRFPRATGERERERKLFKI